jgi:hypothetical protein
MAMRLQRRRGRLIEWPPLIQRLLPTLVPVHPPLTLFYAPLYTPLYMSLTIPSLQISLS